MTHTCEYCGSEFTHKCALNKHQRTAKYCIKQREKNYNVLCSCGRKFLDENALELHQKSCHVFQLQEARETIKVLEAKISFLEGRLSESEKYYSTVEKAALDKKITNNTQYNNILTFPLLDKDRMKEKCKLITPNIVKNGQKALANFFVNRIATNEKGEIGVICTDKTRKMFKYLRPDGRIATDIEAENIRKTFKECSSVVIEKSLDQIKKEYESDDLYDSEEEQLGAYYKVAGEAREFGGPFLAQLIKKTYIKTEDGQLIGVPPPHPIQL